MSNVLKGSVATNKLIAGTVGELTLYYTDAYELDVQNGFEGTIEEWLDLVKNNNVKKLPIEPGALDSTFTACDVDTNFAGGKGYRILSDYDPVTKSENTYTLTTVEGLEVGMNVCARLSSVNFESMTIESIIPSENRIVVSGWRQIGVEANPDPNIPENYLIVVGRPDLGDMEVGFNAIAIGEGCISQDRDTATFGRDNKAVQQYAFITGRENIGGYACLVGGRGNIVIGNCNGSIGRKNTVTGEAATSFGWENISKEFAANSRGYKTQANAKFSDTSGCGTKANGEASQAGGIETEANGEASKTGGIETKANGRGSRADGAYCESDGNYSSTDGYATKASGDCANASGQDTDASGDYSNAQNKNTVASGPFTSSSGFGTEASGEAATAMGEFTKATSACTLSHGYKTEASGVCSRAGGSTCKVPGQNSNAEGYGLIASGFNQTVIGSCNIEDTSNKYVFIAGNGNGLDNPSNAHTLDWNGNAWFAGSVEATSVVIKSRSGYRFCITVSDDGVLSAHKI